MADTANMPTAPVTHWEIRTAPVVDAAILTLKYLTSPNEGLDQAHASPNFVMHTPQLRELGQRLLAAADVLDAARTGGAKG
jgi:hypothetical protein